MEFEIGDLSYRSRLEIENRVWIFGFGIRIGNKFEIGDWDLGLLIGIGDWDWRLRFGIGFEIGDYDLRFRLGIWDWGLGLGIKIRD